MQNEEGQITELYIPRKCSAINRLITSKDHASVQLNIGHLDADGIYTGQFSTFALCGFVRARVKIEKIMRACIIFHNMIVEDERESYTLYDTSIFSENDGNAQVDYSVSTDMPSSRLFGFNGYAFKHEQLKTDLVEHIWQKFRTI